MAELRHRALWSQYVPRATDGDKRPCWRRGPPHQKVVRMSWKAVLGNGVLPPASCDGDVPGASGCRAGCRALHERQRCTFKGKSKYLLSCHFGSWISNLRVTLIPKLQLQHLGTNLPGWQGWSGSRQMAGRCLQIQPDTCRGHVIPLRRRHPGQEPSGHPARHIPEPVLLHNCLSFPSWRPGKLQEIFLCT